MAGEVPPLNVEILVQLSNLTAAVTEATAGLNKIGDGAKAQESKFSALKTTMLGVFAGNLMAKGAEILATGLHDAVKAIEDTQVATEQLSTAMNNAKQNTAANREEVTKTSEKMGALGFSVADSEKAYTKLITATGSTTESTKLMAMSADLARYKHESLAEASATLVKATMGNQKAFREFGITLDATLPKNQAIAKAMDELNGKIGGQAVGYTKTFAGQMEILKAKFDDVAVKVGAVVLPVLTKLLDLIMKVIIPAIVKLYDVTIGAWIKALINLWNTHEGLRKVIVGVIEVVIQAFGYLLGVIAKVVDTVAKIPILGAPFKAMGKEIDGAALSVGKFAGTLDGLANKKIVLPTLGSALATSGGTSASGDAGVGGGLGAAGDVVKGAAAKTAAELKKRNAEITKYNDEAVKLQAQIDTVLKDRQDKLDAAAATRDEAKAKALETFNTKTADIQAKFDDAMKAAQDNFDSVTADLKASHQQKLLDIQQQYADNATKIEQTAADNRAKIIQSSIDVMTSAFANVTKIDIGKMFTAGGGTASGLINQLKDQMAQITTLQKDAGLLAAQGYNQQFINEVISQGPAQGDALAQSVLTAAPATQDSIKQLYAQVQDASQNGLNDLAAQMNNGTNFATEALAKQYAQVGIDLVNQLADNSSAMNDAIIKENASFNKAMDTAQDALDKAQATAKKSRDDALKVAQDTYNAAVASAEATFLKSSQSISDASMKQLDALLAKALAVQAQLAALGVVGGGAGGYTVPAKKVTPSAVVVTTPTVVGGNEFGSITINNNNNGVTTSPAEIATATLNAVILGQTQGITSNGQATSSMANKINQMSYN